MTRLEPQRVEIAEQDAAALVNESQGIRRGSKTLLARVLLDGHFGRFDYGENSIAFFEAHSLD